MSIQEVENECLHDSLSKLRIFVLSDNKQTIYARKIGEGKYIDVTDCVLSHIKPTELMKYAIVTYIIVDVIKRDNGIYELDSADGSKFIWDETLGVIYRE